MDNQPIYKRTHPMIPIAAASVVVMSLVGIGVFTGVIPNHMGSSAEQPTAVAAYDQSTGRALTPAAAPSAPVAVAPVSQPAPVPRKPYYTPTQPSQPAPPPQVAAAPQCYACGRVESVQAVQTLGKGTGIGAVAGGVGGALLGNQVGNGNGRTAMTILGAAGGAFAGNTVEKHVRKETTYQVHVRMDDGTERSFAASAAGAYGVGERVRVENGALVRVG